MAEDNSGNSLQTTEIIVIGGVIIGAYLLANKFFGGLGDAGNSLAQNLGFEANPNAVSQETNPGSPWSANFYQNGLGNGYTIFTDTYAANLAGQIFDNLSYFTFMSNYSAIKTVFNQCTTKMQVSQLVAAYAKVTTNNDMLSDMQKSLTVANVNELIAYVSALPNYLANG